MLNPMQFVNSSKTFKIFTAYSEVLLPKKSREKKKRKIKKTQNKKKPLEILSAFPPWDFCTCVYFRSEQSS